MSIEHLSKQLVDAVTATVLERNPKDETLFANSSEAIVKYFHIEVGVQVELLAKLVKKIESDNNLLDRPLVKPTPAK